MGQAKPMSDKNTKKEILAAYESVKDALAKTKAPTQTPSKKLKLLKQSSAVDTAEHLNLDNLFEQFKEKFGMFQHDIGMAHQNYIKLKEAIVAKEEDLQAVHQIAFEADRVQQLIDIKAELNSTSAREREDLDQEWLARNTQLQQEHDANRYAIEQDQQESSDKFTREHDIRMAVATADLATKKKSLDEREAALEKQQAEVKSNWEQIKENDETLTKAKDTYRAKITAQVKREAEQQVKLDKAEAEKDMARVAAELASTAAENTRLHKTTVGLELRLEEAYSRIESITKSAMEASASQRFVVNNETKS